jgi:hypothetical protein
MSNERFTDQVVCVKTNAQSERELAEGLAAALAGEPADTAKPGSWQRGHQIGTYRREALQRDTAHEETMRAVLVRIGVDQAYGKWNAPVDPASRQFVYLPIPESDGTVFHPNLERRYTDFLPGLESFCANHSCHLRENLQFPSPLLQRSVHLDPDFKQLTYGDDGARRGRVIKEMSNGDLIVFYAGLRPISPCEHKLIYAIVGLYVVDEVVCVNAVPPERWHQNAHTRKSKRGETDIIVRAKRGRSGRLERCIPIGGWRDGSYRVTPELLDAWGGLSVKNGFIQRSVVPPAFLNPQRFYAWFLSQEIPMLERDN